MRELPILMNGAMVRLVQIRRKNEEAPHGSG
jgi:hypothetical protein